MSIPQEHDYIGFSETLPTEIISGKRNNALNLTETELRLGLPGSEFPERKSGSGVSIFGKDLKDEGINGFYQNPLKKFVSGAKRGFADAVNGSGKWGLSINSGSEVDLGQADGLFSPREVNGSSSVKTVEQKKNVNGSSAPASKAQVVGWPPVRSFHKNTLIASLSKNSDDTGKSGSGLYVKVSMDGAPYLRKVDLNTYGNYAELSKALEKMFSCFTIEQYGDGLAGKEHLSESRLIDLLHGSEYVLTYEDKDGDWMLVGDVPWKMFTDSCKRLRIMKGSDAIGLAPRTMQKCKSQN